MSLLVAWAPGTAADEDSTNYRKYGVISFAKADDSKKSDKKDIIILSRKGKVSIHRLVSGLTDREQGDTSGASTPVPLPPPKLPPCVCCRRMEPKSTMARCKTCTFSAHSGQSEPPSSNLGAIS